MAYDVTNNVIYIIYDLIRDVIFDKIWDAICDNIFGVTMIPPIK